MFGLEELAEALEHAGLLLLARLQGQNGEPGGFKDVHLPPNEDEDEDNQYAHWNSSIHGQLSCIVQKLLSRKFILFLSLNLVKIGSSFYVHFHKNWSPI